MSDYVFHTDAVVFDVPGGFIDRSVIALEWKGEEGGNVGLTLQKEIFPGGALEDVVRENAKKMARALKGYKELACESLPRDEGGQAVRLVFELKSDGALLVQHQLYVANGDALLIFGVVGRAADRARCEQTLDGVFHSMKFREV